MVFDEVGCASSRRCGIPRDSRFIGDGRAENVSRKSRGLLLEKARHLLVSIITKSEEGNGERRIYAGVKMKMDAIEV